MALEKAVYGAPATERLLTCSVVCNGSWQLQGKPKLVWHPARLIKEGVRVNLSMDTIHLKGSPLWI